MVMANTQQSSIKTKKWNKKCKNHCKGGEATLNVKNKVKTIMFLSYLLFLLMLTSCAQVNESSTHLKKAKWFVEVNQNKEDVISKVIEIAQIVKEYILSMFMFIQSLSTALMISVLAALFFAFVGILASHILGIYKHRNEWKKDPQYNLMYSYFTGSGTLQRKKAYQDARKLLWDHKCLRFSISGLAYRLGNYSNESKLLTFALSLAYVPMAFVGMIEMIFRFVIGTVWLMVFNIIHCILLFIAKVISYLFTPILLLADRNARKEQHCPHCFETFQLPKFKCPKCGAIHKQLTPGRCGVFFARCGCNKVFLPCTAFTGRSHLKAVCPSCEGDLVAANAEQFSIQLIGGASAGKTAFLAAFQHLYLDNANKTSGLTVDGKPEHYFSELERMFQTGISEVTSGGSSQTYSFVHKYGKDANDNLVIYDIPGEVIVDGSYSRNPRNFGFCDGLIFIIDPLSIKTVRDDCVKEGESEALENYSQEDIDTVIVQFIHQFTKIKGLSARKMSNIPVAIIISKVDIKVVKREVGGPKIKSLYNKTPEEYDNLQSIARDKICKAYLSRLGLDNALNNIDATFSNVRYFPISAIGRVVGENKPYDPIGIMEPVAWIAKEGKANMANMFDVETERQLVGE